MLNSVSRSLSELGRSPAHVGALRRRPLNAPAITRMLMPGPSGLTDFDQTELLFPALLDELEQVTGETALGNDPSRLAVRLLHDVAIADEVAGAQLGQTRLARPEEVARPTQLEVFLRNRKTVVGGRERAQPLARLVGPR